MKVLVALGGNALEDGKSLPTAENQMKVIESAVVYLADLIQEEYETVITHGNGPQVGRLLLQSEAAKKLTPPLPPDVCVAMTQGAIGYQIQQALQAELTKRGIFKPVVSLITRVSADPADPGFQNPAKPIGVFYTKEEADKIRSENPSWVLKEDAGRGWRRVAASPKPQSICEIQAVQTLVHHGCVVIACGGGGIPVVQDGTGFKGVAAVIDKDLAGELLAEELDVDMFIILTAVDQVSLNYNKPEQKNLRTMTPQEVEKYIAEGHFAPGSMLPKVRAAAQFVRSKKDRKALITSLQGLTSALKGENGTWIRE